MKGFGSKLLSRRRHFSYHAWPSGKGIKSGISPLGPTSDSDAMVDANISNSELRQLRRRTPAAESAGDRCKSYVIRDCVRKRMTVLFLYLIGITIVYFIWASTSIEVEVQ